MFMLQQASRVKKPSRPKHPFALGVLLCVTCVGVVFGVFGMVAAIRQPFIPQNGTDTSPLATAMRSDQQDILALKDQDTDEDGMSDYDETYMYQTSPYLKDTDGDATDDKTEIEKGTDANCAEGKNCFNGGLPATAATSLSEVPGSNEATRQDLVAARAELEKLTPQQLRDLLKKKGITDDQLKNLTDDQLMAAYKKSIDTALAKPQTTTQAGTTSNQPVPPTSFTADPAKLTPAQIRDMILQSGNVKKEDLDKLDDATLQKLFLQALQKAEAEQQAKGN